MADEDKDSKTEEPTARRLEKAQEDGQVAVSQELRTLFMLVGALVVMWLLAPWVMAGLRDYLQSFIDRMARVDLSPEGTRQLFASVLWEVSLWLVLPIGLLSILAIVGTTSQVGLLFTPKKLEPKLSNISIIKGFKKIFSKNSLVEFLKSVAKVAIVTVVGVLAVVPFFRSPEQMVDEPLMVTLDHTHLMVVLLLAAVVAAVLVLATADFLWQRHQHRDSLKMSKQELKEEFKDQEGDPQIKGKIRQLRQQRARQRMMSAVPDANVVITNPTHFAVALKYEMEKMAAPTVVAKGQDLIALKIREIAEENDVPIVENPPLARALFKAVDLEEEIPQEHYKAVAEVIGFVMKQKKKDGQRVRL